MTISKSELTQAFDRKVEELGKHFLAFPWENEQAYAKWVAQTYYFVRHTTTLVAMSAAKFGVRDRENHYHLLQHLSDEHKHDQLALDDLKNLGWTLKEIPEYTETSIFYQNQYYMIQHESAFSHLGYSLVLEGLAAWYGPDVYKRISKAHGESAGEFARVHATVDQDHYADGKKALARLNHEEALSALKNLEQSTLLYTLILDRIVRECGITATKKTA